MEIKQEIKNYLLFYKDQPANGKVIADYINNRWGLAIGELEVRKCIRELRQEGNLIVAGNNGYYITKDLNKINKYLKSRWGELTREMKILKQMASSCNMIDQLTIWEREEEMNNLRDDEKWELVRDSEIDCREQTERLNNEY